VQEFDASMEERVEEPECLLLEDVVRLTQAKAEVRSYPWYSVRKMAREIVVGTEKKHIYASNAYPKSLQRRREHQMIGMPHYVMLRVRPTYGFICRESIAIRRKTRF